MGRSELSRWELCFPMRKTGVCGGKCERMPRQRQVVLAGTRLGSPVPGYTRRNSVQVGYFTRHGGVLRSIYKLTAVGCDNGRSDIVLR